MTDVRSTGTRAVSLSNADLRDLRGKLDSGGFDAKEKALVQHLTEQAEAGMRDAGETGALWTWTYRF